MIAVARAVFEFSVVLDGGPAGSLRGDEDLRRGVDVARLRRERFEDRPHLVGVDAPHAGVAELARGPRCGPPQLKFSVAAGAFGVFSDFYLLFIPVVEVLKLQMSWRQKIGVMAVFLTALASVSQFSSVS